MLYVIKMIDKKTKALQQITATAYKDLLMDVKDAYYSKATNLSACKKADRREEVLQRNPVRKS